MIKELIAKVKGMDLNGMCRDIIEDFQDDIISMNADMQLYEEGKNALGISIASYRPYSPKTIAIKKSKGQPYNRVTLRDTGDFERSFFLVADDEGFVIKASDWKAEELELKYGEIFGLTPENRGLLSQEILAPELINKIRNYYGI